MIQTVYIFSSPTLAFTIVSCSLVIVSWSALVSLGSTQSKMGHSRALKWVSTFILLILMVSSIPFLQASRTCLQVRTTLSESRVSQGIRIEEADEAKGVEDSARLVPTGPDPLHHHNNPIKP